MHEGHRAALGALADDHLCHDLGVDHGVKSAEPFERLAHRRPVPHCVSDHAQALQPKAGTDFQADGLP